MGRRVIWDRQKSPRRKGFLPKKLYACNTPCGKGLIQQATLNQLLVVLFRVELSHTTRTHLVQVHYFEVSQLSDYS